MGKTHTEQTKDELKEYLSKELDNMDRYLKGENPDYVKIDINILK